MNSFLFSNKEILILIILIISIFLPFNLINKNSRLSIAHPLIIYSICMFFYTVFCPILQIILNQTNSRGFDFREQYILGWLGASLSVISVIIGYSVKTKVREKASKSCNLNYESIWSIGFLINLAQLCSEMIVHIK